MGSRAIPVVMYHHVSPVGRDLNVFPEHFEDHLRVLKTHGWKTLNGAEFISALQGGDVPRKCVLLTFDDGFADNYVYAYPLLKKYGMKAMIFAATSFVEDRDMDRENLVPLPHREAWKLAFTGQRAEVICTWKELQEMDTDGSVDIQCHGHSHLTPEYIRANDHAALKADLQQARDLLELRLSKKVEHFAWPKGAYSPEAVRIAADIGFKAVYTIDRGVNTGQNMTELKRLPVKNRDGGWLLGKLRIYSSVFWSRIYLGLRTGR